MRPQGWRQWYVLRYLATHQHEEAEWTALGDFVISHLQERKLLDENKHLTPYGQWVLAKEESK
jgi:hypothetical protein